MNTLLRKTGTVQTPDKSRLRIRTLIGGEREKDREKRGVSAFFVARRAIESDKNPNPTR
jgi:hypothetical protein